MLEGPIPDSFFKLTNLKVLGLDDNLLESPISKFASLNQMQKLYLEGKYEFIRSDWEFIIFSCYFSSIINDILNLIEFPKLFHQMILHFSFH